VGDVTGSGDNAAGFFAGGGTCTHTGNYYDSNATVASGTSPVDQASIATGVDTGTQTGYFYSLSNPPMDQWNSGDTLWCFNASDYPSLCWE
jgi:hypothetical protein